MADSREAILVEVMYHELMSISEDMNIAMGLTTRSIAAKEGGDYTCTLLDKEGKVVVLAIPHGLRYLHAMMPHVVSKFKGKWWPGDIVINNDPMPVYPICRTSRW